MITFVLHNSYCLPYGKLFYENYNGELGFIIFFTLVIVQFHFYLKYIYGVHNLRFFFLFKSQMKNILKRNYIEDGPQKYI